MKAFIIIVAATVSFAFSALDSNLKIAGTVVNAGLSPQKSVMVVMMTEDGDFIQSTKTNRNGQFVIELDYDMVVDLEFRLEGYKPKMIRVNTHGVPEDEQAIGFEFSGFKVELVEGDVSSDPIVSGVIHYDPMMGFFDAVKTDPGE